MTILVLVVYAAIAATFISITKFDKLRNKEVSYQESAASEILSLIDEKTQIDNLSDRVIVVFNAYDRKSNGKLSEYGLVNLLEDTYALYSKSPLSQEKSDALLALIKKQKEKDPY